MKIKKHPFTLIEMLISMALTTLILSALMFFYREITLLNSYYDRVQKESFQKRFLENRLSDVLPKAVPEKTKKQDFYFFTQPDHHNVFKNNSPSLIFTFQNGVDLDKKFSNHVLGRIYLDPNGNLTLGMWPSPKRWEEGETPPMKKEILMEGVDHLSFRFFIPQGSEQVDLPNEKNNQKTEPMPRLSWVDKWQQNYQQLPAIVEVHITLANGKELIYAYPLPNVATPIVYTI